MDDTVELVGRRLTATGEDLGAAWDGGRPEILAGEASIGDDIVAGAFGAAYNSDSAQVRAVAAQMPQYRAQHVQDLAVQVDRAMTETAGRLSGMTGAVPLGRAEPLPAGGSPAEVRRWWEAQPDAAPIRNLDGIPAAVRDETNRAALGG